MKGRISNINLNENQELQKKTENSFVKALNFGDQAHLGKKPRFFLKKKCKKVL